MDRNESRLALRKVSTVAALLMILLGIGLTGMADILGNEGRGGGRYAAPLGLALLPLGVILLLSLIVDAINRQAAEVHLIGRSPIERRWRRSIMTTASHKSSGTWAANRCRRVWQ